MKEHLGLCVAIGLIIIIIGTITSVKTILKIYGDNIKDDNTNDDDEDNHNNYDS